MKRSFNSLTLTLLLTMSACSSKSSDSGDSSATTATTSTTTTSATTTPTTPTGTTSTGTTATTTSTSPSETDDTRTGPGEGDRPDRTPCKTDEDCVDACPPTSIGCICHESPRDDMVCVPTCNTDDDCPKTPSGGMICDEDEGICVREEGPGGGGGPGT